MTRHKIHIKEILLIVVFAAAITGVGGYILYQDSLQPSIQVTASDVHTINKEPGTATVVGLTEYRENGMFSHLVNKTGLYSMVFSDPCEDCLTSPYIILTLTIAWGEDKIERIDMPKYGSNSVELYLELDDQIIGRFTIFNPPSNRMLFQMLEVTGSQLLDVSFTLTNSGTANGLADVVVKAEGREVWVNRYVVEAGEKIHESANIYFPGLGDYDFEVMVSLQKKA